MIFWMISLFQRIYVLTSIQNLRLKRQQASYLVNVTHLVSFRSRFQTRRPSAHNTLGRLISGKKEEMHLVLQICGNMCLDDNGPWTRPLSAGSSTGRAFQNTILCEIRPRRRSLDCVPPISPRAVKEKS